MLSTTISKKVWSPNSPFGREDSVFSLKEALSLARRGKARLVPQADAMASITGRLEPAKWTAAFLRARFIKLGMPRNVDQSVVLVFQGAFGEAIVRVLAENAAAAAEERAFNNMVDEERGGKVFAYWKNRPTIKCKTPGGPAMNSQQALLLRRKSE